MKNTELGYFEKKCIFYDAVTNEHVFNEHGSATSQATTGKLLRKINVKCQPVQVRHVMQLYLLKR